MRTSRSGPAYEAEKRRAALKGREVYAERKGAIAEWHRKNRDKRKEHVKRWKVKNREKIRCYKRYHYALETGGIVRGPCAVCGIEEGVEGHHEDYSKPLEVKWLCPVHHGLTRRKY
jgi:hypothetical protein